jgi:hypothetical protein
VYVDRKAHTTYLTEGTRHRPRGGPANRKLACHAVSPGGPLAGMADHYTLHLAPSTKQRLSERAHRAQLPERTLAQRYVEEGLRHDMHPLVLFLDGPSGRRASLIGRGPACVKALLDEHLSPQMATLLRDAGQPDIGTGKRDATLTSGPLACSTKRRSQNRTPSSTRPKRSSALSP